MSLKSRITRAIISAILVSPIAIYVGQFGIGVWGSHSAWAEMGSAIGGIYTPILTLMMLIVISRQVDLQQVVITNSESTKKMQQFHDDFLYYLSHLENLLAKHEGKYLDNYLKQINVLADNELQEEIPPNNFQNLDLTTSWHAVTNQLFSFRNSNEKLFQDAASSKEHYILITLGIEKCVSLDKFLVQFNKGKNGVIGHVKSKEDTIYWAQVK
jgi:hypothetical protein